MKKNDLYVHLVLKNDSMIEQEIIPEEILTTMKNEINEVITKYGFEIGGVADFHGIKTFFEGTNAILSKTSFDKD